MLKTCIIVACLLVSSGNSNVVSHRFRRGLTSSIVDRPDQYDKDTEAALEVLRMLPRLAVPDDDNAAGRDERGDEHGKGSLEVEVNDNVDTGEYFIFGDAKDSDRYRRLEDDELQSRLERLRAWIKEMIGDEVKPRQVGGGGGGEKRAFNDRESSRYSGSSHSSGWGK